MPGWEPHSGAPPVTAAEVLDAIKSLDKKSPGPDELQAEHLKNAAGRLPVLLAVLFSACLTHSHLPDKLMEVTLSPVVKNKSESISNKANYRPIALANVISKLLERIILSRLEPLIQT